MMKFGCHGVRLKGVVTCGLNRSSSCMVSVVEHAHFWAVSRVFL